MNISGETAQAVLETLVREGKLTDSDISAAIVSSPTAEMKRIVDLVHTYFCQDDHDMYCKYYNEENHPECWSSTEHIDWLIKSRKLMEEICCHSEAQIRRVFEVATKIYAMYDQADSYVKTLFEKIFRHDIDYF